VELPSKFQMGNVSTSHCLPSSRGSRVCKLSQPSVLFTSSSERFGGAYAGLGPVVALGINPDVFGDDDALLVERGIVVDLSAVAR
jgi:hypothetical protein